MRNNSESFLESRIRWRLEQHKIPTASTVFWDCIDEKPKIELKPELGMAVLLSTGNDSNFVVLCVFGFIVQTNGNVFMGRYADIDFINDVPLKEREDKMDLSRLVIKLTNGKEIIACPEKGAPAFAVWNTLIMLQRMS